jgi:hypothetical protein
MSNLITLALGALISTSTATFPTPQADNGCARTGCNGEICAEVGSKPTPTLCKVTAESACYQYGTCAKNEQGQCGWQSNPGFDNCMKVAHGESLDNPPSATVPAAPTLDYNKVGPMGN